MKKLFLGLILTLMMSGCFSFSAHQTAETLPEDSVEWGEGIGYYMFDYKTTEYSYDDNGEETSKEVDKKLSIPYFPETIFRFGLMENLDAGIKISGLISTIEGDLKFRLLKLGDDSSNFSLAVQPAASGMLIGPMSIYKFSGAVIMSKRINQRFVVYGNVKYNYLMVSVEDTNEEGDTSGDNDFFADGNYYTATLGLSIEGKKFWLRPELTYTMNKDWEKLFILPALGFGLRF